MKNIAVDPYSAASVPLIMKWNQETLGIASGFFWNRKGVKYLVSNWHVFSGRDPRTGQPKNKLGAIPNIISFPAYAGNLASVVTVDAHLSDGGGDSVWIQHSVHGQKVDVAALALADQAFNQYTIYPINDLPHTDDIATLVAADVFILGFPLGLLKTHTFPIWKRGSIATEFDFDVDNLPCFLVDTTTREGMSGAPVIVRASSYQTRDGDFAIAAGPATKFLGIYSGRHIGGVDEAQLGIVWRSSVIDEIIDNPASGNFDLIAV